MIFDYYSLKKGTEKVQSVYSDDDHVLRDYVADQILRMVINIYNCGFRIPSNKF